MKFFIIILMTLLLTGCSTNVQLRLGKYSLSMGADIYVEELRELENG
jgi:hypothetical protein